MRDRQGSFAEGLVDVTEAEASRVTLRALIPAIASARDHVVTEQDLGCPADLPTYRAARDLWQARGAALVRGGEVRALLRSWL